MLSRVIAKNIGDDFLRHSVEKQTATAWHYTYTAEDCQDTPQTLSARTAAAHNPYADISQTQRDCSFMFLVVFF